MPHIRIVTDNACDIPDALLRQFDITVVPHTITWGGSAFSVEGESGGEILARKMKSEPGPNAWPAVEAPEVEEFTRLYRSMRDTCDGVLSIHVSSRVSEAYGNALQAREAFGRTGHGGPFPIAVIDSMSMSMGLGWLVLAMYEAAESGAELQKLASAANRLAGATHFAFFTESPAGLLKTGHVPRLQAQAEGLNSLKALLHLDEGQLVVYERTRTRPKARDALYNFVEDFPKIGQIAVLHTGALFDVEHLLTRIGAIYPRDQVLVIPAGPTVTAWLGPDAVAVAVLEGEEV
ncbi:MAG TPA: DegV family protein [Chloroflexia bacterium]|jgi:DegV family protein with EDD domain